MSAKLSESELAIADAAITQAAGKPLAVNLAYEHAHPNVVEVSSLEELTTRLGGLKEDVRTLVIRRLGGSVMEGFTSAQA